MKTLILTLVVIFFVVTLAGCKTDDVPEKTQIEPEKSTAETAFKVIRDKDGKHWFLDPLGRRFLSIGINNVVPEAWNPRPNTTYYDAVNTVFGGDFEKWKESSVNLLADNGFNTLGSWSDARLYDTKLYGTICLYVVEYEYDRCLDALRPGFEERVRKNANFMLAKYDDLENVMGVFLDNEMPWNGKTAWEDIANYTQLEIAFTLKEDDPARQAAKEFLIKKYRTADDFAEAWGKPLNSWDHLDLEYLRACINKKTQIDRSEFTGFAAEKFFKRACKVIRELLPGKLILGTRFGGEAPKPVIRACGKYCDVISFNDYNRLPDPDDHELTKYWILGGKRPLMITEYSWRAEENTSGNLNSAGAGTVVKTQADRAANYKAYVEGLLAYPMVIGAHWFEFEDQSPQGRFDGEDSNYGIVDLRHRPYTTLLRAMSETNANIANIHRNSPITEPTKLPDPKTVIFQPGQHPLRPPMLDLLTQKPIMPPELFHAPDAKIAIEYLENNALINYDTGKQWGCGILFFGPKSSAVGHGPKHATDLDSYSLLEIDAEIPASLSFDILIDEAGVNKIDAGVYDTTAGDDGESFELRNIPGKDKRFTYSFEFKDLQIRTDWGNQKGSRRIDLSAMKGFAIFFHSSQGNGTVKIHSIRLKR